MFHFLEDIFSCSNCPMIISFTIIDAKWKVVCTRHSSIRISLMIHLHSISSIIVSSTINPTHFSRLMVHVTNHAVSYIQDVEPKASTSRIKTSQFAQLMLPSSDPDGICSISCNSIYSYIIF